MGAALCRAISRTAVRSCDVSCICTALCRSRVCAGLCLQPGPYRAARMALPCKFVCLERRCMKLHRGHACAALCLHDRVCRAVAAPGVQSRGLLHGMLVPACGALLSITAVGFTYQTSPTMVPQPGQHQMLPFTSKGLMRRHTRAHTQTPTAAALAACS